MLLCFRSSSIEKGVAGFAIDFLMGGVSAAVSKTAAAPIECVKLLIQNQDEMIKTGRLSQPYKGIGECFSRTIKEEGFGSLWRGNTANAIRYFPTQALTLRSRITSRGCSTLRKTLMVTGSCFTGLLVTLGLVVQLVVQLVLPPCSLCTLWIMLELVWQMMRRLRRREEREAIQWVRRLVDVYKKTLASDGIAGPYRGFNISCVGIIVYRGLYFGMYDSLKPVLLTGSMQDSFFASFALGWLITNGAGLASYPIDTVRRRMMMTSGEAVKYKISLDAFTQILKNEGAKSLFKGAGANNSACCCWCWCPCWLRQAPGHRFGKEVWFWWRLIILYTSGVNFERIICDGDGI
ncbi:hypothetical protein L6452_24071 [Arctium lappa]|uniref:Uncharacterized protein n=1 Tax=Arctium lappa TaxID=4217 RepID=A0ACB9A946_ARCLA|nr:hypothetical protein L6452_24071 [Arctium lappa]